MFYARWLLMIPLVFILMLPAMIWSQQTGELSLYLSDSVPKGQLLYVLSKLTGMYAFLFLMGQLIVSLISKYQLIQINWLGRMHKITGGMVLMMALAHLLLFFSAVSIRQEHPAWGMFLPNFTDFYHTHLTFGLFGLWLLFAVVVAGINRMLKRSRYASVIHRGYILSMGLIYFHVLAVGTEMQTLAGLVLYISLGVFLIIMALMGYLKQRQTRMATL